MQSHDLAPTVRAVGVLPEQGLRPDRPPPLRREARASLGRWGARSCGPGPHPQTMALRPHSHRRSKAETEGQTPKPQRKLWVQSNRLVPPRNENDKFSPTLYHLSQGTRRRRDATCILSAQLGRISQVKPALSPGTGHLRRTTPLLQTRSARCSLRFHDNSLERLQELREALHGPVLFRYEGCQRGPDMEGAAGRGLGPQRPTPPTPGVQLPARPPAPEPRVSVVFPFPRPDSPSHRSRA